MKLIPYLRVSTDKQEIGPEAQLALIQQFSERKDHTLVAAERDECHGDTPHEKRPGFQRAFARLKKLEAEGIIVSNYDRIGRDMYQCLGIEMVFASTGAVIYYADGTPGGNTPTERFIRRQFFSVAQLERERIQERTLASMSECRKQGRRISKAPPFGFRFEATNQVNKNTDRTIHLLVPDLDEQNTVAVIQKLNREGNSLNAICKHLNSAGLPSRGRKWHTTSIYRILSRLKEQETPE